MIHPDINVAAIDSPDQIAESKSYLGKPFIRISNKDGTLELTFNQLGMFFGAVKGNAQHLYEQGRLPADNIPPEWIPNRDARHKAALAGIHALLHMHTGSQPSCQDQECNLLGVASAILDVMKAVFQ